MDLLGLTLLSVSPRCLHCCLRAVLLEFFKLHHFGHDEALLKVSVDPAGGLGSLGPLLYSPGLHLIRARSEEVLELESFVALTGVLII